MEHQTEPHARPSIDAPVPRSRLRRLRGRVADDRGSATAEYAVVILAPRVGVSSLRLPPRSLKAKGKHQ